MALATDLKRLINASPERPVPAAGDVARLSWAPGPDSVAVDLASEQDGSALFTVHVPAELAASTLKSATTALVRGMGIDPTQAGAAADARAKMGDEAFARQLGLMVRQPLRDAGEPVAGAAAAGEHPAEAVRSGRSRCRRAAVGFRL